MNENSQEYDALKKEIEELKAELADLDVEHNQAATEYNMIDDEISVKEKELELLEQKAEMIKPKKLGENYIRKKKIKLSILIGLLIAVSYSLTTLSLTLLIAYLLKEGIVALIWIPLMSSGIYTYNIFFEEINKKINKFISKIIQKEINKIKETEEGKKYIDMCNTIEIHEKEIRQLKAQLKVKEHQISRICSEKNYIYETIYEIEDMLITSSNEETEDNSKKKIKKKQ